MFALFVVKMLLKELQWEFGDAEGASRLLLEELGPLPPTMLLLLSKPFKESKTLRHKND